MKPKRRPDELVKAIRKVLEGGKYVSSTLAEKLVRGLAPALSEAFEALSEREYR
jgi:DNA-binding NarL/FixJ family response regulator